MVVCIRVNGSRIACMARVTQGGLVRTRKWSSFTAKTVHLHKTIQKRRFLACSKLSQDVKWLAVAETVFVASLAVQVKGISLGSTEDPMKALTTTTRRTRVESESDWNSHVHDVPCDFHYVTRVVEEDMLFLSCLFSKLVPWAFSIHVFFSWVETNRNLLLDVLCLIHNPARTALERLGALDCPAFWVPMFSIA